MLLKCIKKLGKQVSASDRTDLEDWYNQHIESGLSEHAASAAALTDYHKVLFDATNAMRQAARVKPLPYQRYERPVREEIPPAKVEPSVQPEPSGGTKWNQGDVVTFNGLEGTIKDSYTDKYGESVVVDTANGEKVWPADKIKTTPPASVESSASGEVGGQMTVEEFESSGYELPSGLQNRGVTTIKARGSNKFDVTLKDGKVLSDVLINKSLGGKKVDNKALLTPSETTQIAYNGKMQDFDGEFKDAALKVAVNLSSTDKGYIKTPDGKVYEISSDKKRAKLLPDRITTTAPETRKTQETAAKISPTKKVEPKQPKLAEKEKTTPAATDATTEPRDIPDGTTVTKKVNRKTYTGVVETVDGKQRVGKVSDGKNVLPGTNKLDESWKPESFNMAAIPEVRNDKGQLLAPNGKVSNLNELQWKQVRTPEFIRWFGDWIDGWVTDFNLDENGEPKIWYRGMTFNDGFVIDSRKGPYAAHVAGFFTSSPRGAEEYANRVGGEVHPFFLRIQEQTLDESELPYLDAHEQKFIEKATGVTISDLDGEVLYENKKFIKAIQDLGYEALSTEGNFPYDEVQVLDSTQIKSAIGNSGAFSDDPNILLHKGELTEPMKAILKENVADIIDDAKFRTDGRVITAENLEGYGVLEQAVTKALGENMSLGRPLTPKETQDVIKAIQELAPNSKVGERLVRMLKSASRGGRYIGVGIPESERHELFHALQLQLAAGKDAKNLPMSEVIERVMSPELVKQILDSPLYKKATTDQLYAGSDALKANEFFTAMITGQFEYLGLNPQTDTAEMIELVRAWYADQKARYGDKIDKELYAKINTTTEFFIAELTQSETSNQEETRADRDIGERPTQERAGQADNAADTDEGVKTPAYAKKHLGTDEVEYEPESMSTTSARAEVYARTNDIYDILEDVRHSTGNLPAKMTALYQEQERLSAYAQHLRRQGLETEYQAIIAELKSLTEAIISAQIQTGRAVNMAKILNPLSPEDALAVTARLKKRFTGNENVELSKEYNDQTRKLAEELEKINGELEAAKRKLAEAELTEAQNSDDEKHAAKSNTQSKLLKEYRQKKPEIVAKLKELFPEAPVTFRMAAQPDPLDPEKQELLTQWTTGQILEGLPYTETIDTLKKFGLTADEAQQIHSDAVDVIRPAVAPRTAEVKERAKIRAEHYREAKKFNKNPQSLSVIAQDAQNDDRYNDLIKAIDYLTNTETGQQGRSLSGLINLIREGGMSMADAEQLAHRAKQAVNTIRAERKERRDEARGISKEQRQIINDRTVLKRTASLKMNKHLEGLQRTEWLNHRINNIQRGLFVYNWATQAFNAVAVATVSTPANLMLDSMGAFMRNALGLNVGENQDVRAKDLLLPIYYMIGRNKKLANESLAKFAEQYFRVHTGVLGDIQVEARPQSDNAPALTKPIHKLIDKIDKFMGEKMAVWSGAKGLEMHFRNAMVAARLDQVVRAKSKGAETLESALENGTFLNYVTENDAARAADNALEHTYASEISDPVGRGLKRLYDQVDNFLPLPLNPVTYARFMWTVTQGLVVNPLTFGAYGDTKITGGRGLNNRSIAKGVLAWGSLFPIMALQGAFGGDDDRWDTLYFDDSGTPFSVKRFFPLSAYFFISHHLRKVLYEGAPPPSKEELAEGLMSLEIDYFNYGASVDFWKQISGLGSTTSMDDMKRSTARLLGNYLSGIFRVALPVKQIVSQLNESERTLKQDSDDASDQFVTEMSRSLPFIHKLSDAQPKIDPVTERPILQPWPLGRMFGLGFIHPALLRNEDSPATEWANQYFGYKGTNNVLSAADKNANFIKRRLKEAVRNGTIDLLTADEKAQKFLAGIIEPEAVGRLRDDLKLSELQAVIKQGFGLKQNGDNKKAIDKFSTVWDRSTDKEKEDLRYILERKDGLTPEFMRQFKLYSKPGVIADLMKNPNDVRHWNTDSWARVIESGQLSQKDVDEAAQKLYEKAGNALRSKSLTEAEIQNIKVAIPDFTEEKAKEAASEAAAGKREPTMADLVRKGQMTEADAKKALAEQLKNGEITKRQYTGRLKALSITKVEEDAKDLDASKPEDFAKVKSFLGNVSDADRKKVYDVMTKKIANKTRGDYSVKAKNDQAELRKIVNEWWSGKPAPPDTDKPKIPSIKPVRKTIAPKKPAYQSPY